MTAVLCLICNEQTLRL